MTNEKTIEPNLIDLNKIADEYAAHFQSRGIKMHASTSDATVKTNFGEVVAQLEAVGLQLWTILKMFEPILLMSYQGMSVGSIVQAILALLNLSVPPTVPAPPAEPAKMVLQPAKMVLQPAKVKSDDKPAIKQTTDLSHVA